MQQCVSTRLDEHQPRQKVCTVQWGNETQICQATHPRTHSQKAVEMGCDLTCHHLHESQLTALSKGILACLVSSRRCNCRQDPVHRGSHSARQCPLSPGHPPWRVKLRPRQPAQHRVCVLMQGSSGDKRLGQAWPPTGDRESGTGLAHQDLIWSLNLEVGQERGILGEGEPVRIQNAGGAPWPQCELDFGGVGRCVRTEALVGVRMERQGQPPQRVIVEPRWR